MTPRIEKFNIYAYLFSESADSIYNYTLASAEGEYRILKEQNNSKLEPIQTKILVWQTPTFRQALTWLFTELREIELQSKVYPATGRPKDIDNLLTYATLFTRIEEAAANNLISITVLGNIEKYDATQKRIAYDVLELHGYTSDMRSREPILIVLADLIETEIAFNLN